MKKREYQQPDARWIKLLSGNVITDSGPIPEGDETTPMTFSGKAKNELNKDTYIY